MKANFELYFLCIEELHLTYWFLNNLKDLFLA